MKNKQKFNKFLESIKGNGNGYDVLIEGIKQGFQACFEDEIEESNKENKLGNLTVVNLTPHTIGIKVGENDYTFPSSGKNVRVSTTEIDTGLVGNIVPSVKRELGAVEGLPASQPDTIYIVSSMVLAEIKDRDDVYAPDTGPTVIREGGQVKAVTRLIKS